MTFNTVISRPVENALPNLKMIPTMVPKFNFVENQNFDRQTDGWTGIKPTILKGTRINIF